MEGNDSEFAKIIARLRRVSVQNVLKSDIEYARRSVKLDTVLTGNFACHHTAYDLESMKPKPQTELRQCKGAADWYRAGGQI
jgi:hypothetical protein